MWKRCSGDWGRSERGVISSGWVSSRMPSSVLDPVLSSSEGSGVVKGVVDGVSSSLLVGEEEEPEPEPSSLRWEDVPPVDLDLISMMVLLLKQVHLQNVGAASRPDRLEISWVSRGRYEAKLGW